MFFKNENDFTFLFYDSDIKYVENIFVNHRVKCFKFIIEVQDKMSMKKLLKFTVPTTVFKHLMINMYSNYK